MITATLSLRNTRYPVEYLGCKEFSNGVKLFRVRVTNGFEPFTQFTHGGPANLDTGLVSRHRLSNIHVGGVPVRKYLWDREAKKRYAPKPTSTVLVQASV